MKRSELYALVWRKPVKKAALELGISDVGLAKACRRNDVPVPPRGHWAKLEAGKSSPPIRLPRPDQDHVIQVTFKDPAKAARLKEREKSRAAEFEARTQQLEPVAVVMPDVLQAPHPLVKATQVYCARLAAVAARYNRLSSMERLTRDIERPAPIEHGRLCLTGHGGLELTVSEARLDWALRFHDALFKALTLAGARITHEEPKDRQSRQVVARLAGEALSFTFREGYRRIEIVGEELLKIRAKNQWANKWRHEGAGKFTFTVTGMERLASKEWTGTAVQFEKLLPEIVTTCRDFLQQMPLLREERKKKEAILQREREREIHDREAQAARTRQLEKAFALVVEEKRVDGLKAYLDRLEGDAVTFVQPYADRVRVWVSVVRAELSRANPYDRLLVECLSPDPWQQWPPKWWPEDGEGA